MDEGNHGNIGTNVEFNPARTYFARSPSGPGVSLAHGADLLGRCGDPHHSKDLGRSAAKNNIPTEILCSNQVHFVVENNGVDNGPSSEVDAAASFSERICRDDDALRTG